MIFKPSYPASRTVIAVLFLSLAACSGPNNKKAEQLYATQCASCHVAPQIKDLPKEIWDKNILPDMAARMGLLEQGYSPYDGLNFDEMEAVMKTGLFNIKPTVSPEDWMLLREYIVANAPESLAAIPEIKAVPLSGFREKPISLDDIPGSKNISFLKYRKETNDIVYGDLQGGLYTHSWDTEQSHGIVGFPNPVVAYDSTELGSFATTIGQLSPTQIPTGQFYKLTERGFRPTAGFMHRPVDMLVEDLNKDGEAEIVISEFGDLVGKLTLLVKETDSTFTRRSLMHLPGTVRVIARDMNADQKTDLVVLTAQGDEGVSILYQTDDLKFRSERVIRFSPVYGTSWFDLLDYDGDGDQDIITVHGDNADKSYVHKPYHGFRIHLNDGKNEFEESYFYPIHGATRVIARDFDQDGDQDFCILATFPDYDSEPLMSFVYLKNEDANNFKFTSEVLQDPEAGRWLLVDAGDIDQDGDEDIILSPFSYVFTPVPDRLNAIWNNSKTDLLVLENLLVDEN